MREIVLDTETTGLDPAKGDRIVEIGAVEIVDKVATGRTFHVLINPEREVPQDAFRVHGHSTDSLKDKPKFGSIAEEFLIFIGDDPLVIHNAEFDVRFLNAELGVIGRKPLETSRVVDTLALARRKHGGGANSLDALCDRYRIDRSRRVKHGALVDAQILVEIYCELSGGRQRTLGLTARAVKEARPFKSTTVTIRAMPLASRLSTAAAIAHRAYIEAHETTAIWLKFMK